MKLKEKFSHSLNKILDFIYPPDIYCISCGNLIDGSRPYSLCDSCARTFHWSVGRTCEKCGKPLRSLNEEEYCSDCLTMSHKFLKGFSCLEYSDAERKLIHRFKYKDEAYLMNPMAEAMYDRIIPEALEINLVIPVPMYFKKERSRGYNQAHLLAKTFANKIGINYEKNILIRNRETEAMSELGLAERRENIKNVFEISENAETLICGKIIMLIDDIYTTGSTADACAEVLIKNGAAKVYVYAFAEGK